MKIYKLVIDSNNLNRGSNLSRCVGVFESKEALLESLTLESLDKTLHIRQPNVHLEDMKNALRNGNKYRFTNFYPATSLTTVKIEESSMNRLEEGISS